MSSAGDSFIDFVAPLVTVPTRAVGRAVGKAAEEVGLIQPVPEMPDLEGIAQRERDERLVAQRQAEQAELRTRRRGRSDSTILTGPLGAEGATGAGKTLLGM